MAFRKGVPERQPIANSKDILRVTREWLAFFQNLFDQIAVITAGYVTGPASAVNGNIAVFDGTSGKIIKDGGPPGGVTMAQVSARAVHGI